MATFFNQPQELLKVLDLAINTSLTGLQQSEYLREISEKHSSKSNFDKENPILNQEFSAYFNNPNSYKVVESYRTYLKAKNIEF